jgi:hypothetical protein
MVAGFDEILITFFPRWNLCVDHVRVGLADYSRMQGERHFVHTEVNLEHKGKN